MRQFPNVSQAGTKNKRELPISFIASALLGLLFASLTLCNVAFGQAAASIPDVPSGTAKQDEVWNLYGQFTNTTQWHDTFRSPYQGANSLNASATYAETTDATLFFGVRLWRGAGLYLNPEIDEGFGLSDTLGVAGFPSGEAYKIGANAPYWRIPRAFIRQILNTGGQTQTIDSAANQLGQTQSQDNVIVTVGKFSVIDVFDTNTYAHDPRADFMNWTVIDSGVFDYAADSWGFTYGASAEWTQNWWTARVGVFDLSTIPNGKQPDPGFGEVEGVIEFEGRHDFDGHPGKLKLLVFSNHAKMGSYSDAIALAQRTGTAPSTALVRRYQTRDGIELNLEQEISKDLGVFARIGSNDGSKEAYEFTDVNRSLSMGAALKGTNWQRPDDTVGLALVQNQISSQARQYFSQGGLGLLVGDGRLNYGAEQIAEAYYAIGISKQVTLTVDYQYVEHPAYNRDRGPVSIAAARLHAEF